MQASKPLQQNWMRSRLRRPRRSALSSSAVDHGLRRYQFLCFRHLCRTTIIEHRWLPQTLKRQTDAHRSPE